MTLVLGAADPAQPFGAAVPWPRRGANRGPSRTFGAQVVLVDGVPVLYLERGGRSLLALREPEPEWMGHAVAALAEWIRSGRGRRVSVERFDGISVFGSVAEPVMLEAGFFSGLRGLELRSESR